MQPQCEMIEKKGSSCVQLCKHFFQFQTFQKKTFCLDRSFKISVKNSFPRKLSKKMEEKIDNIVRNKVTEKKVNDHSNEEKNV